MCHASFNDKLFLSTEEKQWCVASCYHSPLLAGHKDYITRLLTALTNRHFVDVAVCVHQMHADSQGIDLCVN